MRTLTGKRIQWKAPLLLTLAAAVLAALFTGAAPTRAAVGDVTANSGWCRGILDHNTGTNIYQVGSSAAENIGFETWVTVVSSDAGNYRNVRCSRELIGLPVSITPNGTVTPDVAALEPELTISIDGFPDNNIPADGVPTRLRLSYRNVAQFWSSDAAAIPFSRDLANADLVANPGVLEGANGILLSLIQVEEHIGVTAPLQLPPTTTTWGGEPSPTDPFARPNSIYFPGFYVVPGHIGEFSVIARIIYDRNTHASKVGDHVTLWARQTFTIVDPTQNNLSEAALSLFGAVDNPLTSADEARPGTDSAPAEGGELWLKLHARNAAGATSGEARLISTSVYAVGGTISVHVPTALPSGALDPNGGPSFPILPAPVANTASLQAFPGPPRILIPAIMLLKVTKTNQQPGEVEVRAIINGDDGAATSETLTLTFTGPAAKVMLDADLALGQPADGQTAQLEIPLSGADAGGNPVAPTLVSYAVTDADGAAVPANAVTVVTRTAGASTPDDASDDGSAPVALVTVGNAAAPGTYTITASIPGVADSSDTATLLVAGAPANLEITADDANPDRLGQVITVSAMVTDADGAAVADGSLVTFTASGTGLLTVGTDAGAAPGLQRPTAAGATMSQFTVIGAGTAVITAAIGNQTEVLVVTSTAGMTAAVEEPGLHCLSKRLGFAVWNCGVDGTAAMIFADLAGRGVKSIHIHDGERWLRYSVINGQVVPGSVDFTIAEHDILYISN